MKTIDLALQLIEGYLISIKRNTIDGCYELEIGIPKNWVYNSSESITCVTLEESDAGKLIKVSPNNTEVVVDDLITFVEVIIQTNDKIAEKEKEFTDRMEIMRTQLEDEAKKFYKDLDELRENSFKSLDDKPKEKVKQLKVKKEKPITTN